MDFLNRNSQTAQQGRPTTAAPVGAPAPLTPVHQDMQPKRHFNSNQLPGWLRVANVVLLFSVTILAVAIALMVHAGNPNESQYVATSKYQAVFLQNGQVYFGRVASLTPKYIDLQSVFYLNSQTQSADAKASATDANQFTLIKLGCELHGPYDQMVINRDQVTFWENLKDDGQVVKTVKEWIKQNPNGQKCSTSAATNGASTTQTGASTQNTATGTTTTPAKKN